MTSGLRVCRKLLFSFSVEWMMVAEAVETGNKRRSSIFDILDICKLADVYGNPDIENSFGLICTIIGV